MISDFIDGISLATGINEKHLIEKDILLHQILLDLSSDDFFASNFLFKGGTCLIKGYFGYYRFSEDLDYTWKDQGLISGKGKGELYRHIRPKLNRVGKILEQISLKRDLDFKWVKRDTRYVNMGGSGKMCTFKIYYDYVISKKETFLKVQISFLEVMCTKPVTGDLQSLIQGKYKDRVLFDEYDDYATSISVNMYDVKEILSEKVRAVLTRGGIKAMDYIDMFLICKNTGIKLQDVEECSIKKTNQALKYYTKYKNNFIKKKELGQKGTMVELGEEEKMLIKGINGDEFGKFLTQFDAYRQKLLKKIKI